MKTAILCGGLGTRLAEETEIRPKPMVEIGDRPILWHIMMHYWRYGHADFVIALGYKGDYIKRWVVEYARISNNIRVHTATGKVEQTNPSEHPKWTVDLIETGTKTQTGGRVKRLQPWLGDETFMLTWGDGVSNIDLDSLLAFHRAHGKLATITVVRPPARFGHVEFTENSVSAFTEKPQAAEGWINGAFFVLEPQVFDYIEDDSTHFEREPLENLARDGQLMAYRHEDFWQCMDTLRDKVLLQRLWEQEQAPWKTWE
jgi:glucose-1-phosphate cytidylyltransferase